MTFVWKSHFDKYLALQRNHKTFDARMLEDLIKTQQISIGTIYQFLGRIPKTVLDIGCGLGIYDLAIHDYFKDDIKFYCLDKTTTESEEKKVYYGYRQKASFYNNLDYTKEFLTINGIPDENIHCLSVDSDLTVTNQMLLNQLSNIDLVISIISWGFHYPLNVYLDTVYQILAKDGLLCFNCRNLEENLPLLLEKFVIVSPSKDPIKNGSFLICRKK